MTNSEELLYSFSELKKFLIERGFVIGTREPYVIKKPEDVTVEALRKGSIRFENNGIFVKTDDGRDVQVFLYKRDYHLKRYGKPKYHICRCQTIDDFIQSGGFKSHYRSTNCDPVKVCDMDDDNKEKEVGGLPLCSNCMRMIRQFSNMNSTAFAQVLKAANGGEEVEEDLFGYTRNWDEISTNYKISKDYTCEKCGLKIDDAYDRQYIHCHHIDGDKKNNAESNLKCLCLDCHAHVNEHHTKRLTTGANKIIYDDFMEKYKK